uniref:ATP synthase complex subunit 8 n=1 Tax=Diplonevra peregrina TaxID=1003499 RepID=A0A7U3QRX4_9MUSC|nr:ATP synthase F0 subunit 8 [Diplonevra peregrina]QPN53555.1 ATP synthase F0 subunit 8 [Diplonevra peregrina]
MPQMAPISWLLLFIIFSMTFIMVNILNYYNFIYKSEISSHKSISSKSMNWKW